MSTFEIVAAAIVAIVSTARITRLVTQDTFPPSAWVRAKWEKVTHDGHWAPLVSCPWCFSVWASAFVLGWGLLSNLHWTWWVFNGWMALAYLAAMVVVRDGE